MSEFHRTRDYWHFWAGEAERGFSPVYAALSRRIGDDPALQALCDQRKPHQPPANLLFAAVHFLLLDGRNDPLSEFYPHLGGRNDADPEAAFPLFRDFCLRHEADIRALIAARVTNTNEVRRSTYLMPLLHDAWREAGKPLHLVEMGPSAGLNLVLDRYAYRYRTQEGEGMAIGDARAPLLLDAEWRGPMRAIAIPPIARRIGLELNPVDLAREDDRRWLKALLWPGRTERFHRLDAALAAAVYNPPEIRPGSAVDTLEQALSEAAPDTVPVVMHSVVMYQFAPELHQAFADIMARTSRQRLVMEVSCEYDGKGFPMVITRHENGNTTARCVGEAHQHGEWLSWNDAT